MNLCKAENLSTSSKDSSCAVPAGKANSPTPKKATTDAVNLPRARMPTQKRIEGGQFLSTKS
eukprot:881159-Amphidinium_carterae.1